MQRTVPQQMEYVGSLLIDLTGVNTAQLNFGGTVTTHFSHVGILAFSITPIPMIETLMITSNTLIPMEDQYIMSSTQGVRKANVLGCIQFLGGSYANVAGDIAARRVGRSRMSMPLSQGILDIGVQTASGTSWVPPVGQKIFIELGLYVSD